MRLTPPLTPPPPMQWLGLRAIAALAAIHLTRSTHISDTPSRAASAGGQALDLPHRLAASIAGTLAPVRTLVTRRDHATRASLRLSIRLGDAQLIALLATALSIAFYIWYAQQGLTLAYGDSISHMMIARRVLVSRHPGLAQFGTVWPPFTHILMLPLVWNDDLYRSGFAGAFPSMLAYVLSAVYMLRLGRLAFASRAAGWIAALALMLNPSVLYMQSTPMTEMGLICTAVIAIYYAVSWAHNPRAADLVKCATATAAGTLIRYDGWALALALTVILGFIAWRRWGWTYAESHLLLFGTLAFAGCASWLVYNRVIFGNWLEFYNGPYAAMTQQSGIQTIAHVPTVGDPLASLNTYGFATIDTAGALLTGVALSGLLGWLVRRRYSLRTLPILAALIPFLFNWLSLVKGVSIIETPEIVFSSAHTYFNERYGMMMLPAIALFMAWLATRNRPLLTAILLLVLFFTVSDGFLSAPYALQDPLHGANLPGRVEAKLVGQWMRAHCQDGETLASAGSLSPEIFSAQLPDTAFVTEGDGADFAAALAHPEQSVSCIAMLPDSGNFDPVWSKLHDRQDWRQYFVLRKVIDSVELYQRVGNVAGLSPETPVANVACCQAGAAGLSHAQPQSSMTSPCTQPLSPLCDSNKPADRTKGAAARVAA